ncbi:MAG TPA: Calx-beta domain-containing protein [Chitinispirillaceae bacterium]|nr:Calx-beta domain-containing protein [Chitinispirillaceae bacterium]
MILTRSLMFIRPLLFLIIVAPTFLIADKICSFKLENCPENFNGKTVYVPENVTSISPDFKVCIPVATISNEATPPSIMFIIDHSNSMMGSNGLDKDGSRFLVTQALIDTLNKQLPQAEVGLVIFYDKLFFNADDDSLFQKMPDTYTTPQDLTNQAYIPLMQLNKKQKNGMTGIEYLKYILQTKKIVSSVGRGDTVWSTDLAYQPTGYERGGGTHINVAFDAALDAMKMASYTKENQYIIFFSDGEANRSTGTVPTDQYSEGTGVPTTFTVYFTSNRNGNAPQILQTMTSNIKTNNYSAANPASQLWTIQTNYSTLMDLVMENIFNPLIFSVKQKPTTLIINNKSYATITDSTTFNIGDGLKLNDSLTHFDISVKYQLKDDSLKIEKDTSINVSFDVIRSNERAMSEGIALDCSDTIYYTISAQATDATAKEKDARPGTITFTRDNTKGSVTVYFSKEGTATYKDDYTIPTLDSVTFKDGEKSITLTITPVDDAIKEPTENVDITLLDKFNDREIRYYINKSQSKATVTIEDSYVPPPDTLTIHITPNPFSPNNSGGFSKEVKTLFSNVIETNNSGMLIAVHSTAMLEKISGTTDDEYGTGYIYDAVGNLVTTIKMKKANSDTRDSTNYGFLWNCKNSNQRTVGLGTYLIKIRFKEVNGQTRVFTRKMGVKE